MSKPTSIKLFSKFTVAVVALTLVCVTAGLTQNYSIMVTSAVLLIAVSLQTAVKIRKAVIALVDVSDQVISGKYEVHFDKVTEGAFGVLENAIEKMVEKIRDEVAMSHSFRDNIKAPLLIADKNTVLTHINSAACEILHASPEQVVGKVTVKELFGSDKAIRSALSGNPIADYSMEISNWAGERIPVLASSAPIRKAEGEIVGSFLTFFDMRKNITKQREYLGEQIKPITDAVKLVASGNLAVDIDLSKDSQLVGLAGQIDRMIENLRTTLLEISQTSSSVATATVQINSSTEELAAGAQEQSAQTTEVAAAVEQMTKTVYENSRNATLTAEVARNNGALAKEGSDVVIHTVNKIREIAEVVQNSASTVERLGTSTQEIGKIVLVIDDIADQTNLLALNAAIEAARAGEDGRGFAVVADEVRKLAERTTQATKQIAAMIKNVQKEAAEAVSSMKRGSTEVAEGIKLADRAGDSLKNIVQDTGRVVDMMTQIAAASEEQSATSEQISRNIEAISTVSSESAHGISNIAGAADNLNRLTENLITMVQQFNLASGQHESGGFDQETLIHATLDASAGRG